ncbi:class II aldolase/adducin family protein [Mesorhizobium sp. M1329]|uniref:class II aldolase/adducin family protein n=1 Tax=Mesorhizobium sp. M1329 TaxID=2957083 RepID=UPI003337EF09
MNVDVKFGLDADIRQLRIDLAAAFRLAVEFDWHESVSNHFSASVSDDGTRFLMNRKWQHFSEIRASDLILFDATDIGGDFAREKADPSAWSIHGHIHRLVLHARVVLHCHPPYATALASLKDPRLKAIDQATARFFGLIGLDLQFGGLADERSEGQRIATRLGEFPILMMGNHGVTVSARTVAEAFHHLYYLERAARTLILAYSSGQPLAEMPDALAASTADDWISYNDQAFAHFDAMKRRLDRIDPSYRD